MGEETLAGLKTVATVGVIGAVALFVGSSMDTRLRHEPCPPPATACKPCAEDLYQPDHVMVLHKDKCVFGEYTLDGELVDCADKQPPMSIFIPSERAILVGVKINSRRDGGLHGPAVQIDFWWPTTHDGGVR